MSSSIKNSNEDKTTEKVKPMVSKNPAVSFTPRLNCKLWSSEVWTYVFLIPRNLLWSATVATWRLQVNPSIYILCLSVICQFVSNKSLNGWTNWTINFVWDLSKPQEKFMLRITKKKSPKTFDFQKSLKMYEKKI